MGGPTVGRSVSAGCEVFSACFLEEGEEEVGAYLIGCVEGCHEAGCVSLDLSSCILAVLILLCVDSVEFEEEADDCRTGPRVIGR